MKPRLVRRPLAVAVAWGTAFYAVVAGLTLPVAIAVNDHPPLVFPVALVLGPLGGITVAVRMVRTGVRLYPDGRITITNPLRTHRLTDREVKRFVVHRRRLAPTGAVELTNGQRIHIWALGVRNRAIWPADPWVDAAVARLNAALHRRARSPLDP